MSRIILLDNLRGLAFIFMIIHHIFYFYDVTNNYTTSYAKNIMVDISGTIARTLFVFLAGISLVLLSKNKNNISKRLKRSLEIAGHGLIITAVTYYFFPKYFIRFGVLHFIALAYPEKPSEEQKKNYKIFFDSLKNVLPCILCSNNYKKHLV